MRPKRVLCVSYDAALLITRRLLLERAGDVVTSASSFKEASAHCRKGKFDLLILGHSIPLNDKARLMKLFRVHRHAPILSLQKQGEEPVPNADYYAFSSGPEEWLQLVAAILEKRTSPGGPASASTKLGPTSEPAKARKPSQSA